MSPESWDCSVVVQASCLHRARWKRAPQRLRHRHREAGFFHAGVCTDARLPRPTVSAYEAQSGSQGGQDARPPEAIVRTGRHKRGPSPQPPGPGPHHSIPKGGQNARPRTAAVHDDGEISRGGHFGDAGREAGQRWLNVHNVRRLRAFGSVEDRLAPQDSLLERHGFDVARILHRIFMQRLARLLRR